MTTNLGNKAQCNTLIANSQVKSPSFSQRCYFVGSATTPTTATAVPYIPGINKYVFFNTLTSGASINKTFTLPQMPINFFGTYSCFSSATSVPSTSFDTLPVYSAEHQVMQINNLFYVNVRSSVAPVFSGTAYLKVVIQFTLD